MLRGPQVGRGADRKECGEAGRGRKEEKMMGMTIRVWDSIDCPFRARFGGNSPNRRSRRPEARSTPEIIVGGQQTETRGNTSCTTLSLLPHSVDERCHIAFKREGCGQSENYSYIRSKERLQMSTTRSLLHTCDLEASNEWMKMLSL